MSGLNFLNGMQNVEVEDHIGTWYSLDKRIFNIQGKDVECVLMEHEEYGDLAASVIIDTNEKLIIKDCFNGWLELEEKLMDLDTLEEDYLKTIKYDEQLQQTEMHFGRAKVYEMLKERKNNEPSSDDVRAYHFFKANAYFLLTNESSTSNN